MSGDVRPFWVEKSDADRRRTLTPEQDRITRQHGTQRAFTGLFLAEKGAGTYRCLCRGAPLFRAGERRTQRRQPLHMPTELRCGACEVHLGHALPDGPAPEGLRTRINGTARMLDPHKA